MGKKRVAKKANTPVLSESPPYANEITLRGSSDVEHRINVLTTLFDQAVEKINHIDESRQRNMNYALVVFAGLVGLGVGLNDLVHQLYTSAVLVIVMGIFCLWDRRLHRMSHGWQGSSATFCRKISEVVNEPGRDITFPRYRADVERGAQWVSFQPMIFYALVLGGIATFLMFLFL